MAMSIDEQICNGCGTCVTACPNEAIRLSDGHAMIEDSACTECGTCIDLCPRGAIQAAAQPARAIVLPPAALPPATCPQHPAWLATLGAFLGHEVLPVVLDGVIAAFERRLAAHPTVISGTPSVSQVSPCGGRGQRRQQRRRARRVA